jgi:hypothetical protein
MKVVYHVAGIGHYKEVVAEQLALLQRSGITEVEVSHVGPGVGWVKQQGEHFNLSVRIVASSNNVKLCEAPAIEHVWQLAKTSTEPIAYMHTKGVSRPDIEAKQIFRRVMGEHVIGKWRENVAKLCPLDTINPELNVTNGINSLPIFDAVGCNWFPSRRPHFSGNFWIAKPEYLRTLPDARKYCHGNRFKAETWIGANKDIRPLSLLCRGVKWWEDSFPWAEWLSERGISWN